MYDKGIKGVFIENVVGIGQHVDAAIDNPVERQSLPLSGFHIPTIRSKFLNLKCICLLAVNNENEYKITTRNRLIAPTV